MDQGPLTHTNGGSPGDPHLGPLFAGPKLGVLGGPPGGFWDPPGDGGHLTDFVAN